MIRLRFLVSICAILSAGLMAYSPTAWSRSDANVSVASPVLEPSTLVLIGLGLVGLAVFRARFRHEK